MSKAVPLYHLDQLINERGFGFDAKLATAARDFLKKAKDITDSAISKHTHGAVGAATQRARLLKYLNEKLGAELQNLRAPQIREYLEYDDISPEVRFLLEMRLEAAKSAGSKYARGLRMVGVRSRIRHTMLYNGAGRTGRTGHKGFQPGNMQRPVLTVRNNAGRYELMPVKAEYIDNVVIPGIYSGDALKNDIIYGGPNEAAALAMRHVIKAASGNELVVADYSNIESVVLAWIAGQEWKLAAFKAKFAGTGADVYKMLFSRFFGVALADIGETERQGGKVVDLACGFGGGVGAIVAMAATYQLDLDPLVALVLPRATPEQLKKAEKAWRRAFIEGEDYALEPAVYMACDVLKQTYRETNDAINQLRHDVANACMTAIETSGRSFRVGRCIIWRNNFGLLIQLPSGRRLIYASPKVFIETVKDMESGKVTSRKYITYLTARGQSWIREKAWSGLFIENIVQAIANDCLRGALLRLHRDTYETPAVHEYLITLPEYERTAICLHIHDEIVLDVPKGSYPLERMLAKMTAPFNWSAGLPLNAAGWVFPTYGKRESA